MSTAKSILLWSVALVLGCSIRSSGQSDALRNAQSTGDPTEQRPYFPEPAPYEGPPEQLLRIGLKRGVGYFRLDDREIRTSGPIEVEFVNLDTEEMPFSPTFFACTEIHIYIVGVNDDSFCHPAPQLAEPLLHLRPGQAFRLKVDFRKNCPILGGSPKPRGRVWGLKPGCYDARLTVYMAPMEETFRLCYAPDWKPKEAEPFQQSHGEQCAEMNRGVRYWPEIETVTDNRHGKSTDSEPSLVWAARFGNESLVTELLDQGANPSESDGRNRALSYALKRNHKPIIERLVSRGAFIGVREIVDAAQFGGLDMVEYLVSNGAKLNNGHDSNPHCFDPKFKKVFAGDPRCTEKITPISLAAERNSAVALGALVKAGALLNNQTLKQTGALNQAARECSFFGTRYILDTAGRIAQDLLNSALVMASSSGCYLVAEQLIERGADTTGPAGRRSLRAATRERAFNTVRLLIEKGADANGSSSSPEGAPQGETPLIRLCGKNFGLGFHWQTEKTIVMLLDHGADPNATDDQGRTALIRLVTMACEPRTATLRNRVIDILLDRGANPQIRDKQGKNALQYAREKQLDEVVTRLERN